MPTRKLFVVVLLVLSILPKSTISAPCSYSSLWGRTGENWQPSGSLPDFSYAGYHASETAIPKPAAMLDLKRDFHAKGDGVADDSAALTNAVQSIKSGVLFIPKGTYLITKPIDVTRGNLIIRGAGPNETVLSFPNSLTDLFGNKPNGAGQSQWSFRPGFINITGKDPINQTSKMASVVGPAKRGDRILKLSNPIVVKKGEWIRLIESDPQKGTPDAGSLIRYLYGNLMPAGDDLIGTRSIVRFLSRVKSVSGASVELERPIPYDVRTEWLPEIHRFTPTVQEFGLEHLSIHFPWSPYPGHFKEKGYNGLFLQDVAQSWINDVEIQNADFGVDLNSTNFCTVTNVNLTVSEKRDVTKEAQGGNGHHGIDVSHGTENLVTDFHVKTRFIHDISVEWYALHTVFANGTGIDLNMDHHREANYSSLFSNLDLGLGTRSFNSGGSSNRGAHSGAYSTFWNIYAASAIALPPPDFGPLLNFIGLNLRPGYPASPYQWHIEQFTGAVCPAELQIAMRNKRLSEV